MTATRQSIDLMDRLVALEMNEMDEPEDIIRLFADLIKTGLAWQLQGSYGRAAADLISRGLISKDGEILIC